MSIKPDHKSRAHALLSASSSSRWIACTPSARLEDKYNASKPSTPSPYAEEGTLAHEIGELMLRLELELISKNTYTRELRKLKKSKYYSDEMIPHVEVYVATCMESFNKAKTNTSYALAIVEERVDFSHVVPEGFGTGDFGVIDRTTLEVIDLKFGKGLEVSAVDNPQLKLYAAGLYEAYGVLYDIETIKMTIVQPRLNNYSTFSMTVQELIDWQESIKPAAQMAYKGEGTQVPGSHCKFCKVKALCKAYHDQNLALAQEDFKDPYLIDESRLLDIYKLIPMLMDWGKGVSEYMLKRALHDGKNWPGYKLVSGTSRRKWVNEKEVVKILRDNKFTPSQYQDKKLKGIPTIEKLVGTDFGKLLAANVLKPEGAPTLVEATDKRPGLGIEQAIVDFSTPLKEN